MVDVSKKGEDYIIFIYVDIVNEVYLYDVLLLFEKVFFMLLDIVLYLVMEGNGFLFFIVESEKRVLL